MSFVRKLIIGVLLTLTTSAAWSQTVRRPSIGYLYPAGARRGGVTVITVGGQYLNAAKNIYISWTSLRTPNIF